MQQLGDPASLQVFQNRMAAVRHAVILLDYDGTLAPFSLDTREVRPYPGVATVIDGLVGDGNARVIIVTGRYLREAPPVLGTRYRTEVWGSHGRERLYADGAYEVVGIDEFALRALTIADAWTGEVEAAGGRCEAKPGSIAFHWRGAGPSQIVRIRNFVTERFQREAFETVLELHSFDGGIELRAPGWNKGNVVTTVLAETEADIPITYLGDDLTDEDAFETLRGRGLGVLVRTELRKTKADVWIRPPAELLTLLRNWREILAGGQA